MDIHYHGFKIFLMRREDEGWISWTPQQPGLSSWGVNKVEALRGIRQSIKEYIVMKKDSGLKKVKSE